jgi:hypothetical protein
MMRNKAQRRYHITANFSDRRVVWDLLQCYHPGKFQPRRPTFSAPPEEMEDW